MSLAPTAKYVRSTMLAHLSHSDPLLPQTHVGFKGDAKIYRILLYGWLLEKISNEAVNCATLDVFVHFVSIWEGLALALSQR